MSRSWIASCYNSSDPYYSERQAGPLISTYVVTSLHLIANSVKQTSLYSPSKDKHLELFDPEQYYLLLHPPSELTVLLAYVALRVCKEDTKESLDTGNEGKQVDVLYM